MRALKRGILVLPVVALLAGACSSDSTGSTSNESGSLDFSYAGDVTGTYSVSGVARLVGGVPSGQFAAALTQAASGGGTFISIGAFRPGGVPRTDAVFIDLPATTGPTTVTVCATAATCAGVEMLFGLNTTLNTVDTDYVLTSGTVVVSTVSSTRVTGTFSGTGVRVDTNGQAVAGSTFTITNGHFDTPVRNDLGL
ncbi:MAG TPA: hypothetical protein VFE05_01060 [Longimicrobiaceae bacterium]|jgi:hypothetical protein|nr:hypothetical protein [Longimicrobiaceae bacterium]